MSEQLQFSLRLPAHPLSVAVARSVVRSLLPILDTDRVESAELVLSEILTNSIRHASRDEQDIVEVEIVARPGQVTGRVRDSGAAFTLPATRPRTAQIGGYGLHIAMALSDLNIAHSTSGNTVTFTVPASGA